MNDVDRGTAASIVSTCLFGAVALLGLLFAGLWVGSGAAALLALIALGASYVAQLAFTWTANIPHHPDRLALLVNIGLAFQGVAVVAWVVGVLCLLPALWG